MAKKDFENGVKLTGKKTQDALEQAIGSRGTQTEADEEEKARRIMTGKTQGRKGCKAARINMSFTPENHEFILFASRYKGMNFTQFVNNIIEKYREEHADAYRQARELSEDL